MSRADRDSGLQQLLVRVVRAAVCCRAVVVAAILDRGPKLPGCLW